MQTLLFQLSLTSERLFLVDVLELICTENNVKNLYLFLRQKRSNKFIYWTPFSSLVFCTY